MVAVIVVPIAAVIDHRIIAARQLPFGNVMSEYFYFVNTGISEHNLVVKNIIDANSIHDPELNSFYAHLDWTPKKKLIDYYKSNGDAAWHSTYNPNFLKFWQALRPQIRALYNEMLPPIAIDIPVVHFRCSDIPFVRHPQYHLTKADSVKWMAEKVNAKGYDQIIFLNCTSHRRVDKTACEKYAMFYINIFQNAGISVKTQCNTILQDFALMVSSPLVVSLNASSFSFMAGIAKDPSNYISCNMGIEFDGKYFLQTEADWIINNAVPLLHKDVTSYNNTDDVITKLL